MNTIKNEIIRASKKLNIKVLEISSSNTKMIIDKIVEKYAQGKRTSVLWENFAEQIGINEKDAWMWIKDFIKNSSSVMFFNPEEESAAFEFRCGEDVDAVLNETFGFEFYITNKTVDYVLCFNHHDVLIVCGDAIPWLKKYVSNHNNCVS